MDYFVDYHKTHNEKIICLLCRHKCKLQLNATGMCGVNKNVDNKLKNLVYGYPSAINIDPIEKKPLFHFLPSSRVFSIGTKGCNFRCPFCQNYSISQNNIIDYSKYYSPKEIALMAKNTNCSSIAFTYNEPSIFYPYAKDISLYAKELGLKTVFVSNGIESPEIIQDMLGVIDAVNIDLKSFDEKYYKKTLKGKLGDVLNSLEMFVSLGIWTEVTTLIIDEQNNSDDELNNIASFIANNLSKNIPWHISAFHPDYKMLDTPRTKLSSLEKAYKIGKKHELNYIYYGNAYEGMNTYCPKCNHELIKRERYEIKTNHINNSKCPKCDKIIDGVFSF